MALHNSALTDSNSGKGRGDQTLHSHINFIRRREMETERVVGGRYHLWVSLKEAAAASREQSAPLKPPLHTQRARQLLSATEHVGSAAPEGSVYLHAPFPEHTESEMKTVVCVG